MTYILQRQLDVAEYGDPVHVWQDVATIESEAFLDADLLEREFFVSVKDSNKHRIIYVEADDLRRRYKRES